jgi:hypothetical protein
VTSGRVTTITPDRRGDTLLTATGTGTTVLEVEDTTDFDEDGGWLVIADSAPIAYTGLDDDAGTVDLAAPVGAVFEAGLPIDLWDPTVPPTGAKVVEYVASVDVGHGVVPGVTIPHELIPAAGVDNLIDASVALDEDDDAAWYIAQVFGREPSIDLSYADASTLDVDALPALPGAQTISYDAPTDTAGYAEDAGWWQVDADGKAIGFWRLVAGVWTPITVVYEDVLNAGNVLTNALSGKTITGTTIQTRSTADRGIKLGQVQGSTNYDEAFLVFNESGVPFIKAVPSEELAVIAGEVKATTTTSVEGASLGGITEITRGPVTADNPTGSAGALRLTAYTTAPKSAPTVTTGYDTVQFTDDGDWGERHGWTTDGTYWYTVNQRSNRLEKWSAAGALITQSPFETAATTCVVSAGKVYALVLLDDEYNLLRYDAGTLAYDSFYAIWTQDDGTRSPALGVDAGTGDLLIAQSRPSNSDKVRIKRYTMPATIGDPLVAGTSVDSDFAFAENLSGVSYGTFDFGGASRYVFTGTANQQFKVIGASGATLADEDWQAGMGAGKVGFAYTGGAFVSMDKNGLLRTYTGQDKAVAIGSGDLTKWVSNTLANVTYETDQSPRAKIVMPKRTKLNVTTSAINTTGTNAPDRVRIYVGRGSSDPGRTKMERQGGLWTGPVLTNLYPDPSFETAATGWSAVSGSTTPATSTEQSWVGAKSLKTQRGAGTAVGIAQRTITTLLTAGAGAYSYAIRVFIPTGVSTTGNTGIRITGTGTTTQDKDTDVRGQWVTLTGTFTWDGVNNVFLQALDSAITAGIVIYLDAIHLVAGSTVPTIYAEGSGAPSDNPIGITTGAYSSLIAPTGTNPAAVPPPSTNGFVAAGGTVQALELADGTKYIDGLGVGAAWTTYTPTFTAATTALTLGSFTRSGRYARLGRNTIAFSIVITATSASGYGTGAYEFGLPVAARATNEVVVHASQSGPNHMYIGRNDSNTTGFNLHLTSTDAVMNSTSSGMANGTVIRITGTYEAA